MGALGRSMHLGAVPVHQRLYMYVSVSLVFCQVVLSSGDSHLNKSFHLSVR